MSIASLVLQIEPNATDALKSGDIKKLRSLWRVCSTAPDLIKQGKRLENALWRLYSTEAYELSHGQTDLSNSTEDSRKPGYGATEAGLPKSQVEPKVKLLQDIVAGEPAFPETALASFATDSTQSSERALSPKTVNFSKRQPPPQAAVSELTAHQAEWLKTKPIEPPRRPALRSTQSSDISLNQQPRPLLRSTLSSDASLKDRRNPHSNSLSSLRSSVVKGFAPGSVSVAPSTHALREQRLTSNASLANMVPEPATPSMPSRKPGSQPKVLFKLDNSSESDLEIEEQIISSPDPSPPPAMALAPAPPQPQPRSKSVLKQGYHLGKYTTEKDNNEDMIESDIDSQWDDVSDDGGDVEMFSERQVPINPELRPSLLSSLFLNVSDQPQSIRGSTNAVEPAVPIPSRHQSGGMASGMGGDEDLIESQSVNFEPSTSLYDFAKRKRQMSQIPPHESDGNSPDERKHFVPVEAMFDVSFANNILVPEQQTQTANNSYTHDLEDINDRELSSSVKMHLKQSKEFELESLWPKAPVKHNRGRSDTNSSARPALNRSVTVPISQHNSEVALAGILPENSGYHATGW